MNANNCLCLYTVTPPKTKTKTKKPHKQTNKPPQIETWVNLKVSVLAALKIKAHRSLMWC